ncbi:adenosine 5'-monophosphoramidase HINT1-like [Leguminivora glycinivorella]|uniref:adenosine 5'-monophosphoramidase HINT1-like n=1 Tax=Leguminivora glycinivorella TaxID=1035111 RepID=UPI00201073F1|nr:adenosine 5'-monophosphoramidase HINT1-like [Leguminivora glycinivorella]
MATKESKSNSNRYCFGVKPAHYIYEDDLCYVFDEQYNPQALVHYVVAPKKNIPRLCNASDEDEKILGHLLIVAKDTAALRGLKAGYHVVVDEDCRAGASGRLRALHVFGRALHHMLWPTGPGARL